MGHLQKNKGTMRVMEIHCEIMGETDKHRERERGRETDNAENEAFFENGI